MHVVTVEFIVKPEHADRFRERVEQQAADSLAREDQCHVFDVCRDPKQAERFFLYEVYEDEAAFQSHLCSAHFKAFDRESRAWVTEKHVTALLRLERN